MANFETSQIRLPNNDLLILKDTTARTAAATAQTTAETAQATADSKVTIVSWDATNKKLTKTINGSTTDIVAGSTILSGLTKAQVTSALGYTPPTEDTNTTYSLTQDSTDKHKFTLSGTDGSSVTVTIPDNNTTYTFAEGSTNGAFTVTPSGKSAQTVKIHGLGNAAYKGILDTYSSTSTDAISGKGVAAALASLPTPMVFKGSLGTGGTITTLPTASASNNGHSYKVITNGTYAGVSAKAGDMFISDGTQWVYIPSADEPSGTVTSVGITNGGGLSVSGSPITTSGTITISHADTSSQASVNNSGRTYIQDISLDTYGHVTGITSATETVVDTNTTYAIGTSGNNITLTPSSGSAQSVTAPYATKALNNKDGESITATYRRLDDPYYDTVYATEEEVGDLIVTGAARFLNTINGSITGNAATATNVAWSGVTGKPTTLGGYGITDAKIANGVITLGSNTITPLTSHQTVTNKGATLAWKTTSTIATIGGTDIKVTMPDNPNTNTTYTLGADTKNNKITLTPSSGDIQSITVPYATSSGSAGSATKATQDESGNNIKASYASSISISDHTITLKNKNGVSLGTVTVPDNNTTYSLSASGESVVLSGSDNSSSTADLSSAFAKYTPYKGNMNTAIGQNTPAAATKTYWESNTNIPTISVNTAYNSSGTEYTLLFSKGSTNNYGSILRWGYSTPYLEILRRFQGNWQSTDWEKISAGYADTAGSATKATQDGSGNVITSTYLPLAGGTVTGMTTFNKTIHSDGGQHLYGGGATNSMWYKITLATNGLTPPSSQQWYMCSLSLDIGGDYNSGAKGRIELSYYIHWSGSAFAATNVYGFASGANMGNVEVYYKLTEPFIIYVKTLNQYSSLWVRNVTYRDSAYTFRTLETKVETSSAITVENYTAIPISRLYTSNGTYLTTNSSLVPQTNNELYLGSSNSKWSYVYATKFIGALQGNADTATSASSATTAANLNGFTNTTTSGTAIDSATQNGHVYVTGASGIYSQNDGAAFVQAYSTSWVAQIYQDYKTGQIALRGKNNGTWQAWRKVWDSVNLKSETAAASGTTLSLVTTGEKATWNAKASSDTKNTAGSTDTSSKIFLIGATSQAANPQTYSDNEIYTTSGVLTTKSVQVGGGSATMEYSATTKSINFIFAN